jgi:hypothetical protein
LSDITRTIPWWQGRWGFTGVDVPADANDLLPADADGDGIIDSLWVRMPSVCGSRGEPIFAAVRIVDNCGMLNLNTAHVCIDSLNGTPPNNRWPVGSTDGKYLSSVDYFRFLRGQDMVFPLMIMAARDPGGVLSTDQRYHNMLMWIENPGSSFHLFDIADELEIRNRFMLTSLSHARFEREDIGYETFDYGRGDFPGAPGFPELKVKRIPYGNADFTLWRARLDPVNFDNMSGAYFDASGVDYRWYYDRRHVCTFYSFDRNMRTGVYPAVDQGGGPGCNPVTMIFDPGVLAASTNFAVWDSTNGRYSYNNPQSREKILRLLYALRAYYLVRNPTWDYKQAARRAAQTVANMIDYTDDNDPISEGPFFNIEYGLQTNDNPTFIDRFVINRLIYDMSGGTIDVDGTIDANPANNAPQYDFGLGVQDPRETVYGYERQPFISEIARDDSTGTNHYAIELCNPYENPNGTIYLNKWRIKIGSTPYPLALSNILNGACEVEPATVTAGVRQLGRAVIVDDAVIVPVTLCR